MPPLEDWFNIVAMCLDAMCLEAPVKMIIAQTAGYRVAIGCLPVFTCIFVSMRSNYKPEY